MKPTTRGALTIGALIIPPSMALPVIADTGPVHYPAPADTDTAQVDLADRGWALPLPAPSVTVTVPPTPTVTVTTPAPKPKPKPEPAPEPTPSARPHAVTSTTGVWAALAACESSGNPRAVDPTGTYYGLYQFDQRTWRSVGGKGRPDHASPAEQTRRAKKLHASRGWQPWPVCSKKLGLR